MRKELVTKQPNSSVLEEDFRRLRRCFSGKKASTQIAVTYHRVVAQAALPVNQTFSLNGRHICTTRKIRHLCEAHSILWSRFDNTRRGGRAIMFYEWRLGLYQQPMFSYEDSKAFWTGRVVQIPTEEVAYYIQCRNEIPFKSA